MPGDKGRDESPARDKWQRAISKVAASTAIAEETAAGERFARIVLERTFVDTVNNERAFLAAFGQRSLHNQLSSKSLKLDSGQDLETELAALRKHKDDLEKRLHEEKSRAATEASKLQDELLAAQGSKSRDAAKLRQAVERAEGADAADIVGRARRLLSRREGV